MADDKKEDEKQKAESGISREPVTVAQLSVPTIIAALHENAIAKSDAKSKGVKVVNSAIDAESGKASLKSAGEHIISVLPLEGGKDVEKAVAIEVIKQYVQWFVGPDLAKKVDDKSVKSLAESPDGKANESVKVMSFSQFLLEAEDADEDDDDGDSASEDDEDESADEDEDGEDADEDDDDGDESSESSESSEDAESDDADDDGKNEKDNEDGGKKAELAPGYYIPYSLKVEGLKQTALKDALKQFASKLIGDIGFKIKGSGLFGSGGEIEVSAKKIGDAIKGVFGAIDPKKLKEGVRKSIGNKLEDSNVEILGKDDITKKKYAKSLDPQSKAQISKAEYSLVISGKEKDPEKPEFNKRNIADIVQSSIVGLFKKFKNKITKNDVILIQVEDREEQGGAEALSKKLLKTADIDKLLDGKHTYAEVADKIKAALDPLSKDKQLAKNPLANGCVKAWQAFYEKRKEDKRFAKDYKGSDGKGHDDAKAVQKFFKPFVDAYKKQFEDNKLFAKALAESAPLNKLNTIALRLRSIVLESLFNEDDEDSEEDDIVDDDGAEPEAAFDPAAAQKATEEAFSKALPDFTCTVKAGAKGDLKSALAKYDTSELDSKFGEYANGIAVDFGKMMNESVRDQILGILFEDDSAVAPSADDVKKTFVAACQNMGISDFGDVIALSPKAAEKKLNEADGDSQPISAEDLGKISDVFKSELINIAKAEAKITVKPIAKLGSSSDVQAWLAERGLDSSEAKAKLGETPYAAAFVLKKPADIDGSGKLKHGSLGFNSYTKENIKAALDKAVAGMEVDEAPLQFDQKSNGKLLYYKTKIPAECAVYVIGFKPPEETSGGESGDEAEIAMAYVLPVGNPESSGETVETPDEQASGDDEENDDSTEAGIDAKPEGDSQKKPTRDVYIIPMPGLKADGSKDED